MRSLLYRLHGLALLVVVALAALVFGAAGPPQIGGTLTACAAERALFDGHLLNDVGDLEKREACIADLAELHSSSVRLDVSWAAFEPKQGVHDETQAANLDAAVNGLRARGIRVMLTVRGLPPGRRTAPTASRRRCRADSRRCPRRLRPPRRVPGLALQRPRARPRVLERAQPLALPLSAAHGRRPLLRAAHSTCACSSRSTPACSAATPTCWSWPARRRPSASTTATAPARSASRASSRTTAPRRYFDVYSHHPYTPGGSAQPRPRRPPNDPSTTVALQNLPTLLRLFPTKPFYLTEYGYNTRYTASHRHHGDARCSRPPTCAAPTPT